MDDRYDWLAREKWIVATGSNPLKVYPGRGVTELVNWEWNCFWTRLRFWAWGNLVYPKNKKQYQKAVKVCQVICDRENEREQKNRELVDSLGLS